MALKIFTVDFSEYARHKCLRCDEKFHIFNNQDRWNLFNIKNQKLIPLKNILIDDYNLFQLQKNKEYRGIPTGKNYIDEDGDIIDYQSIDIDSCPNRLRYKITNENILISSLRLAKSPALFFENENLSEYVFSNGFYIFKVNNNWNNKLVIYILRTKRLKNIIDNHIYRGIGISAYKSGDLLKIKIPLIPKQTQDHIVAQIEPIEQNIKALKATIQAPQEIINTVFAREFGFDVERFEEARKQKFFEVEFSNIAKFENLNQSPKFNKFILNEYTFFETFSNIKLGQFIEKHYSGEYIPSSNYVETSNIAYVSVGTFTGDTVDFENTKFLKENLIDSYKNIRLRKDDFVFTRSASVGSVQMIKNINEKMYFIPSHHLLVVKIKQNSFILNTFLEYWLRLRLVKDFFVNFSQGKIQKELTNWSVFNLPIPNIPLAQQQKIVDEIKTELDKQEAIKQNIETQRNKIDEIINISIT